MSLVGKNIDAFCSRCRLTLAHIVLYEVGGAVHRVKCKTCGANTATTDRSRKGEREIPAERRPGKVSFRMQRPVRPADARLWEQRNAADSAGRRRLGLQMDGKLRKRRRDRPPAVRPGFRGKDLRGQHGGPLPGRPEADGDEPPAGNERRGQGMTVVPLYTKIPDSSCSDF